MFTAKDRQRQQLIRQQCELKRKLMYTRNLSDEEKASLQMQIDSYERRIDAGTGKEDIFSMPYSNCKSTGVDIFAPEKGEVSEEAKAWMFGGYDFGVPRPEKPEPHLTYYCQFQNGKKR